MFSVVLQTIQIVSSNQWLSVAAIVANTIGLLLQKFGANAKNESIGKTDAANIILKKIGAESIPNIDNIDEKKSKDMKDSK